MLQIKKVQSKKDLSNFIAFPDALYKNNLYRVPQLHTFEKGTLDSKKNPAFDFCEADYWLAIDNGKIVGRIAGISLLNVGVKNSPALDGLILLMT